MFAKRDPVHDNTVETAHASRDCTVAVGRMKRLLPTPLGLSAWMLSLCAHCGLAAPLPLPGTFQHQGMEFVKGKPQDELMSTQKIQDVPPMRHCSLSRSL